MEELLSSFRKSMGASNSTEADARSTGGLQRVRDALAERLAAGESGDELDVDLGVIDMLLKKLGKDTSRGQQLHYTCRGLGDLDMRAVATLANAEPAVIASVTSINLSHNLIADTGVVALGKVLSGGAPALLKIALHENKVGDEGLVALAAAMRPSGAPNIQVINLAFNRIEDTGIEALATAFAEGGATALRELHLAGNRIGDVGARRLFAQVHHAPRLLNLAFGSNTAGNLITDAVAHDVAQALASLGSRESGQLILNLKNNKLTDAGEAELTSMECDALKVVAHGITARPPTVAPSAASYEA